MDRHYSVVVGSTHLWNDANRVGLHFLIDSLIEEGHDVEWITIPFSLIYFLKPTHMAVKWQKLTKVFSGEKSYSMQGSLINRVPLSFAHPVSGIPFLESCFLARSYLNLTIPPLTWIFKKDGIWPIDLLIFDAGGMDLFYPLHRVAKLTVYRLSDLVAEFPGQARGRSENERDVLRKADLVLPVSQKLYEAAVEIRGTDQGVYLLPNGVKIELFLKPTSKPPEYSDIPKPIALFTGALSTWFDWDLLAKLAKRRPDISFVLVGRGSPPFGLPKNVYLLGYRVHKEIPSYMQHADVGLILFKNIQRINRVERPLKFYEYLASGLPIVSVPFGGLKSMSPYAFFGGSVEELSSAVDRALSTSSEYRNKLREEAKKFSWDKIFREFKRILTYYEENLL